MFTKESKIIHSELQNADIKTLSSQDEKLTSRNVLNARASYTKT